MKIFVVLIFLLALLRCGDDDEAKQLGFPDIGKMKEIQAVGWHTMKQYDEDRLKGMGFSSEAEFRARLNPTLKNMPLLRKYALGEWETKCSKILLDNNLANVDECERRAEKHKKCFSYSEAQRDSPSYYQCKDRGRAKSDCYSRVESSISYNQDRCLKLTEDDLKKLQTE